MLLLAAVTDDDAVAQSEAAAAEPRRPGPLFVEEAHSRGLRFSHRNGMTGALYMPETVGAGGALLDFDGDGDLDVYLAQGGAFTPGNVGGGGGALFRNLLREEGALRFVEVAGSGIEARGYGMGAATGDFDNDGRVDLYLTNFGPNQLWRNRGDGTFADVTAKSGVGDPAWSVSASFLDYDRDGWLDLFVADYLDFRFEIHKVCRMASGAPDYCGPSSYAPVADRLYRNRGDGTFEDVTARSGVGAEKGAGLGVLALDADDDGWLDLYVANDQQPNFLWRNRGDGTFEEIALLAGCAVDADGRAHAGMGVDAADFDSDGDLDLVVSNLTGETHTSSATKAAASSATPPSKWVWPSRRSSSPASAPRSSTPTTTARSICWWSTARCASWRRWCAPATPIRCGSATRCSATSAAASSTRARPPATRSRAPRSDAALCSGTSTTTATPTSWWRTTRGRRGCFVNVAGSRRHWIGLEVMEGAPSRHALGAAVTLERAGRPPVAARVATDGSYASARDPRVLFGLGDDETPARVRVRWPDGAVELFSGLVVDRYQTLTRGKGAKSP